MYKGLERNINHYSLPHQKETETMTKQLKIQTILRSELIQWKTMSKENLINNLVMLETEILESADSVTLDMLVNDIDMAEIWGQTV